MGEANTSSIDDDLLLKNFYAEVSEVERDNEVARYPFWPFIYIFPVLYVFCCFISLINCTVHIKLSWFWKCLWMPWVVFEIEGKMFLKDEVIVVSRCYWLSFKTAYIQTSCSFDWIGVCIYVSLVTCRISNNACWTL